MDVASIIIYSTVLAAISSIIYIFIGILPGTDETATMAPVALALLLAGLDPIVVLAWFMASIVAFKIADAIPVALAGIPGGVMAVPQVPDALVAKEHGLADTLLRKGNSAALVAAITVTIFVLVVSYVLMPLGAWLNTTDLIMSIKVARWFWLILGGVIFLAVTSKNKLLGLFAIPAFAILVQGIRGVYGKPVSISLFLGITIGPIIYEIFTSLNGELRKSMEKKGKKIVKLSKVGKISINPFKNLTKEEILHIFIWSPISSILATVMSPVGLTILIGDTLRETKRNRLQGSVLAYTVREGIKLGTYIGGTLIPLLVIGAATGPMSAGPAAPFFQMIPTINDKPFHYILTHYSYSFIVLIAIYSVIISLAISYPLIVKYSRRLTLFVFNRISAESLYGLFVAIAVLLAYYDAGIPGIFGMLLVSVISGALNKLGVSLGVLFMTLVGASIIVALLAAI
ncbi:tripartite tricarboxylate transporter permease [Fervidicoccus sp.]|uniref:tripartite tricarboxylate transporter permease n=1 Tax=Fervidicoccus sp. TaxID=2060324 RepID=UPI003D0D1C26